MDNEKLDAQTPQTTSSLGTLGLIEATKLLRRALTRLKTAQGYMPSSGNYDKEAGALATLVREIQRFLS